MNENGVLTDRTSTFAVSSDVPGDQGLMTPANNRDVVVADFNNDGWPDFATAVTISDGDPKHISHPRIYMNQGAPGGNWQGFRFEQGRVAAALRADGAGNPRRRVAGPLLLDRGGRRRQRRRRRPLPGRLRRRHGTARAAGVDINDRLWINDGTGTFTDSWQTRMSAHDAALGVLRGLEHRAT